MPCLSRAQPLQIILRRCEHTRGTRHGFDDDRRNRLRAVQRHETFERVGVIRAPLRLALREGHACAIVRQRQVVVGARKKGTVRPAVVAETAHGNAGEGGAVIALLAPDQPEAAALPDLLEIGTRDL
jgi:hypothetical protein